MNLVLPSKLSLHFLSIIFFYKEYFLMVIKLFNEKIFIIELKIIINDNLYKKNIIDEKTFSKVNDLLLHKLKLL